MRITLKGIHRCTGHASVAGENYIVHGGWRLIEQDSPTTVRSIEEFTVATRYGHILDDRLQRFFALEDECTSR